MYLLWYTTVLLDTMIYFIIVHYNTSIIILYAEYMTNHTLQSAHLDKLEHVGSAVSFRMNKF